MHSTEIDHRQYPPPQSPWVITQSWHHVLFAHWKVDARQIREQLPHSLPIDLYEGQAWISIVAFDIKGSRPRGLPSLPLLSNFPEVNVRTYVTRDGKPGIYTFSLDTNNLLARFGARWFFYLPYFMAKMSLKDEYQSISFASARDGSRFIAQYAPTEPVSYAEEGSLNYWLTERYCIYSVRKSGEVYRTDIHHQPWPLQEAKLHIEANTLTPELPPTPNIKHYARRQDIVMWLRQQVN